MAAFLMTLLVSSLLVVAAQANAQSELPASGGAHPVTIPYNYDPLTGRGSGGSEQKKVEFWSPCDDPTNTDPGCHTHTGTGAANPLPPRKTVTQTPAPEKGAEKPTQQ
jgi:hypothetical protein